MARILVFGPGTDRAMYEQLLERARAVAARFGDRVSVEELDALGEQARALGLAGSPALAVDDQLVCVRSVPSLQYLTSAVQRRLCRE
jgi:hypothetical protein